MRGRIILLTAAMLAACAEDDRADDPLPAGVSVEVGFIPNLALLRRLEVALDNGSSSDVVVTGLGFRSPLFASVPSGVEGRVVTALRRQAMEIALGEATCPPGRGPTSVDLAIEQDGRPWQGTFGVDVERLVDLNAKECAQRVILDRLDIALSPDHTIVDDVLMASLVVHRRDGDDEAVITDIGSTLLFSLQPVGPKGALATLAPGEDATAIDVAIESNRCDAHTVSQSMLSYRFPLWVAVDGREPQYVIVEPPAELRAGLESLVQACIAARGNHSLTRGAGTFRRMSADTVHEVRYEVADHVATITLNAPERMNTISGPMLAAISQRLAEADRDRNVRCVVLTGAGRAFCAGLDLAAQARTTDGGLGNLGSPAAGGAEIDVQTAPPVVLHQLDTPTSAR